MDEVVPNEPVTGSKTGDVPFVKNGVDAMA
jgi:hypothetical protein